MKDHFIAIDILRVLTILFVIMVRHIDDYASDMFQCQFVSDVTVISLGVLVYISGYLLVTTNQSLNSITDIKVFIIKKILRIYPLYALALLIFYFLSIINEYKLISGLLLYNIYIGEYILTLWFIPMIMAFYLIFVLLDYNYNLRKFLSITFLIFLLLLTERIIFRKFESVLIVYFPAFIFGILAARYSNYLKLITKKSIFFLLIIFFMILFLKDLAPAKLGLMFSTLMIISFSLSSMFFLNKIKINKQITKFVNNLSYASFCMYLIHRAIFSISLLIWKPSSNILTLVYLYMVSIPVIYYLSFAMQKYYDKLIVYATGDGIKYGVKY